MVGSIRARDLFLSCERGSFGLYRFLRLESVRLRWLGRGDDSLRPESLILSGVEEES